MQIIKNDKLIKIIADENMRITNKKREYFNNVMFLPPTADINEYEEVGYNIWKYFVDGEIPNSEVDKMQNQINELQEEKDYLETILLNTDFRLTCMELKEQGLLD